MMRTILIGMCVSCLLMCGCKSTEDAIVNKNDKVAKAEQPKSVKKEIIKSGTSEKGNALNGEIQMSLIIASYKQYNRQEFSSLISETFSTGKTALLDILDLQFARKQLLSFDYEITNVSGASNTIEVAFSWSKKFIRKATNQLRTPSGNSVFVFQEKDGSWFLTDIKKDNPL